MKLSDRLKQAIKNLQQSFALPPQSLEELNSIALELWDDEMAEQFVADTFRATPRMASALNTQEAGDHYKGRRIQPVEYMHANGLDYSRGAVVKYVTRDKVKGGADDIKKAIHFCRFILEMDYDIRSSAVEYEK